MGNWLIRVKDNSDKHRKAETGTATTSRAEGECLRPVGKSTVWSPVDTRNQPSSLLHSHLRGPGEAVRSGALLGHTTLKRCWGKLLAAGHCWLLCAGNGESSAREEEPSAGELAAGPGKQEEKIPFSFSVSPAPSTAITSYQSHRWVFTQPTSIIQEQAKKDAFGAEKQ